MILPLGHKPLLDRAENVEGTDGHLQVSERNFLHIKNRIFWVLFSVGALNPFG